LFNCLICTKVYLEFVIIEIFLYRLNLIVNIIYISQLFPLKTCNEAMLKFLEHSLL